MHEQVVIDGHGTYDELGLELISAPTLSPPELNTVFVDVPGGSPIDLTEYSGDATYGKREQDFEFVMTGREPDDIEVEKTRLSRLLHGLRSEFTLSWDPGYTYTGRWWVKEYPNAYHVGTITLHVQAEPWKSAGTVTWLVNAAGGITLLLPCGRKRTCPTIEVNHEALVSFQGESWTLEPGASRISDLWIKPGQNEVTINTYPAYCIQAWSDITGAWSAHAASRWSELCAGDSPLQASDVWTNHATQTWADIGAVRWIEMTHDAQATDEYAAYIQYDVKEL